MEYKQLVGFSGINRQVSNFLTKDGEFSDSQNFNTKKVGVLKKAGDYESYVDQISGGLEVWSGVEHVKEDNTREHLIAVNKETSSEIYKNISNVWTSQSQNLTVRNRVRMAYFPPLRTTFAVNFADATRGYHEGVWDTWTNLGGAPRAKDVISFGDRIWLLNCILDSENTSPSPTASVSSSPSNSASSSQSPSSSESMSQSISNSSSESSSRSSSFSASASPSSAPVDYYPERAYMSSIVNETITWDTVFDWVTFEDEIVGGGRLGDHMFVGCKNSCYLYTINNEKVLISTQGIVSVQAIASYGKLAFYATRDGVYAHDGGNETKISEPIQEYWEAISESNLADVSMCVRGNSLFVSIGTITLDEISMSNVVFEYDILQNDWNKLSYGFKVTNLHTFVTSTGKSLFGGSDAGKVWKLQTSSAQNGEPIHSYWESDWVYGGDPKTKKSLREFWGYGKDLSGINCFAKSDDGEWQSIGKMNGSKAMCGCKINGYRFKFLVDESSKNNMYELHMFEYGYENLYEGAQKED